MLTEMETPGPGVYGFRGEQAVQSTRSWARGHLCDILTNSLALISYGHANLSEVDHEMME